MDANRKSKVILTSSPVADLDTWRRRGLFTKLKTLILSSHSTSSRSRFLALHAYPVEKHFSSYYLASPGCATFIEGTVYTDSITASFSPLSSNHQATMFHSDEKREEDLLLFTQQQRQ